MVSNPLARVTRRLRYHATSRVRRCAILVVFSALLSAVSAQAATPRLFFAATPPTEVLQDSAARILLTALPPGTKVPDSCRAYASGTPTGNALAGHTARLNGSAAWSRDSLTDTLAFKPVTPDSTGGPQLALGIHYLVLACGDGTFFSPEIPLLVSTGKSPTILSPKSEETSSSPTMEWTPVPGVPAYHLLLSDQAININAAKGTVSGASIIWQAITTKSSIAYGAPDPSGNFSKVPAPPLSPGVPYNLVILNNYDGRSALATSAKAQALKLFTIKAPAVPLPAPRNLAPAQGKTLLSTVDSVIRFSWNASKNAVASANTYKLFVYSRETQNNLEVLVPNWQTEVTDTFAVLDAKRTLLSKSYVWKVFAVSDAGAGMVGDTTSFQYHNDVQTLILKITTLGASGDTVALGDVRVDVVPVDNSADPLPLFTIQDGSAEKELAVGNYALTFTKSGYVAQTRNVTLTLGAPLQLTQFLPPSSARIIGHMIDGNGVALDNVGATAAGGGKSTTAVSDAGGFFLLGLSPGSYALAFSKSDYQAPPDTLVTLAAGKTLDFGKVLMIKAQGALSGTITNDKGVPLSGCQVSIQSPPGVEVRGLLSDDKGAFAVFLAPGAYVVAVSRTGFASDRKSVQIIDAATVSFQLASGASVVKGQVNLLTWPTASTPQSSPLPGATIVLKSKTNGGPTQTVVSDDRGGFSFSADTGNYTLKTSLATRAKTDSVSLRIGVPRSTVGQDVSLTGFASVQGSITIMPDTVVTPGDVAVNLLSLPGLQLVRSVTPEAAATGAGPTGGGKGDMIFTVAGLPDGNYKISCGLRGYGLDAEPTVTIKDEIWKTGVSLPLKKATRAVTFALTAPGITGAAQSVMGTLHLLTPLTSDLASATRLAPAPAGTYTLNAVPDSLPLLPLRRYGFPLASIGPADTTVTVNFPFAHNSRPLEFQSGEVELALNAALRPDSVTLVYGYTVPTDTFHVPASQLLGPPGSRVFRFRPGPQGGLLTYYFIVRAGALTYSNEDAARRFHAPVAASHELATLRLDAGDSLRLPARARGALLLHAYDAGGNRLDSAVDARGTVRWKADSLLPIKLDRRTHRALTFSTLDPRVTSKLPKSSAASAYSAMSASLASPGGSGSLRQAMARTWDTLRVTVSLDGVDSTLSVTVAVVSARINKLALTATLGEVSEIPSPTNFGIQVAGFDTTTTPPTPLVPNPVLSLAPPQAGTLSDGQVRLDPRFIGPLRVLAKQINPDGSEAETELGAYRDSLQRGLNVGQTVRPADSARLLFHDPQFEMRLPDSTLTGKSQAVLRMYPRTVARTFSSLIDDAVSGNLYEIANPSAANFARPLNLILGIPSADRSRKVRLDRFDAARLAWDGPSDSGTTVRNSFGWPARGTDIASLDGSYYGLLAASGGLSADNLEILPNPFSPLVIAYRDGNTEYGTRIRFTPETNRSSEVTVSLRIYNQDGELVRVIADHKTVAKQPVDFYWDGRSDGGRWARNGRYLLKVSLTATGTQATRHILRPVVVYQ